MRSDQPHSLHRRISLSLILGFGLTLFPSEAANKQPSRMAPVLPRVFEESLVPMGGSPTNAQVEDLARALESYRRGRGGTFKPLEEFLEAFPDSPWRASLQFNLGVALRRQGFYSRAMAAWESVWQQTRTELQGGGRDLADQAMGELLELNVRLGQKESVKQLLQDAQGRAARGKAREQVDLARAAIRIMDVRPEEAFRCGPESLGAILKAGGKDPRPELIYRSRPTVLGTNLSQLQEWADRLEMDLQPGKKKPGIPFLVPSLVHFKQGHFAAVLGRQNGDYWVDDPVFGQHLLINGTALEEETSGFALVPKGQLPPGWGRPSTLETSTIWGRGFVNDWDRHFGCSTGGNAGSCGTCAPGGGGGGGGKQNEDGSYDTRDASNAGMFTQGMASFKGVLPSIGLLVGDVPVGYAPPRGPAVRFEVGYFQRDTRLPASPAFTNLGPRWSFAWLGYIKETTAPGTNTPVSAQLVRGIEGQEWDYANYDSANGLFAPQFYRQDRLVHRSSGGYEIRKPNGSKELYTLWDGTTSPQRYFLTQVIDAAGNTVTLSYDYQFRLTTIQDALGQVTQLFYERAGDPYKLTKVTDPFDRSATFQYSNTGQLIQITDVIGIKSQFDYQDTSSPDFMTSMTTPYGIHGFKKGESLVQHHLALRWLEATDPLGLKERWEYCEGSAESGGPSELPTSDPVAPSGFVNRNMNYRNAFYWSKRAFALYPNDHSKAELYQWLHTDTVTHLSAVMGTQKRPHENRTWYAYPNQSNSTSSWVGSDSMPIRAARILDDLSEQNSYFQYNPWGKVTQATDPAGRQTSYVYSPDGLDLLEVRNTSRNGNEVLAKYTYAPNHKPLTATDAAGQITTYTYNGFGQVLTITNPKNETTTFSYDGQGYLQTISGPHANTTTTFTYDSKGRVRTVTGPDGSITTTSYDDLDRTTEVLHADGRTEQMVYDRLDLWKQKDRQDRWTVMTYNPLRQLVEVEDPFGRVTKFDWCGCGNQLEGLTDPRGNKTTWLRDLEGRVIAKILADGTSTKYGYDLAGRLSLRIDAMDQRTQYSYGIDNNLQQVSYPNALKATPTVSYSYDTKYNRLATSTGAFGTTTYSYHPITTPPSIGGGRLAGVASPWANSNLTYTYDELGRVQVRGINGVNETRTFDALGRLNTVLNPLGGFTYSYDGTSSRLKQVSLPNGQNTKFDYYDLSGDFRLKTIDHQKANGTSLSTFGYTYEGPGTIKTWAQSADTQPPKVWTFTYDAVDQLTGAVLNGPTGQLIRQFTYGYDLMGNRTSVDVDGGTTTATHNNTNQLTGQRYALDSAALARKEEGEAARRSSTPTKPGVRPVNR